MAQYYNIDDILAEDELVPAIFREATNGVGLFDSSDDTNKVEPGSKVELPFWLARELHLRQAVTINVPPCFNKKTREEIDADAAHVDLRNRCPYFYELGYKIAPFILVLTINGIGLGLELIYLIIFFIYGPNKDRLKIEIFVVIEFAVVCIVGGLVFRLAHTYTQRSAVVGIICVVFGIIMYASPLTIMNRKW